MLVNPQVFEVKTSTVIQSDRSEPISTELFMSPKIAMRNLNYDLKQLVNRHRDGSFTTRDDRHTALQQMANDLHTLGFRQMRGDSLKPKHIEALTKHWLNNKLSVGTMKNRMAHVRWWASKIGKSGIVMTNDKYGIGTRRYSTNVSKGWELKPAQLDKITDRYTELSLKLQQTFGLRREESIKFSPSVADHGDRLALKGSWTKGGKPREIIIRTLEQRALVDEVWSYVGRGSLIPSESTYRDQLQVFKYQTQQAGIHNVHGLRHQYAQNRYEEMTGLKAPAAGGPTSKQLTIEQKQKDFQARMLISRELGHEREQITVTYLGR